MRRHLPRTLSRFEARLAGPVLLDHYLQEADGVTRYKILRGLGTMKAKTPGLRLSEEKLDLAISETMQAAFWALEAHAQVEAEREADSAKQTQGGELLVGALWDKYRYGIERLSRLFGLRFDNEDFEEIYAGFSTSDDQRRAVARELLEAALPSTIRAATLALVDRGPVDERLERARPLYERKNLDYAHLLAGLLESRNEVVVSITIFHIAELGLTQFGETIAELSRPESEEAAAVYEHALLALAEPTEMGAAHVR